MSGEEHPDQPQEDSLEVVRFYTSTRKFPKLVGKLPTGEVLPGGPYTVAQFVWALAVGFLLLKTKAIWGTANGFMNIGIIAGGAVGAAYIAGRMPATARNPLTLITYVPEAWGAPTGRYRGGRVKLPTVERVAPITVIDADEDIAPILVSSPEPALKSAPSPTSMDADIPATESATVSVPLSAVQSLLAGASRSS